MTPRLYIAIPVRDRMAIAAQCVPTVREAFPEDWIHLYDDGTTEEGAESHRMKLLACASGVARSSPAIGIEAQRRMHLKDFWERRDEFTGLYFTDADAIHDPTARERLLALQEQTAGRLVCGYNTLAHVALKCVVEDDPRKPYVIRRVAPGISYLLTREHVERIMSYVDRIQHFDWQIPAILGGQCVVARESCVEHIGWKGAHHKDEYGMDGGDRALNPTPWLVAKRSEILDTLRKLP